VGRGHGIFFKPFGEIVSTTPGTIPDRRLPADDPCKAAKLNPCRRDAAQKFPRRDSFFRVTTRTSATQTTSEQIYCSFANSQERNLFHAPNRFIFTRAKRPSCH
jgi:hypothetical protein